MSFARDTFTASEEEAEYTISFPFIADDHVNVYLEGTLQTRGSSADYQISGSTVTFNESEAEAIVAGDTVILERATSQDTRLVVYQASSLPPETLNNDSLQAFYMAQEAIDKANNAIILNEFNQYDAVGIVVTEVGEAEEATDAINLGDAQALISESGNVPDPVEAQDGYLYTATGEDTHGWQALEVSGAQIEDTAVDTEHLVNESVTGAKLEDASINEEHFVSGSVDVAEALESATGAEGDLLSNEEATAGAWNETAKVAGVAKAWIVFDGTAGTPAAAGSLNVSSIEDNGTGDYGITLETNMANANYAIVVGASQDNTSEERGGNHVHVTEGSVTTEVFGLQAHTASTGSVDAAEADLDGIHAAVFGVI